MADAIFGAVSLPRNLKGKAWDERLKAVIRAVESSSLCPGSFLEVPTLSCHPRLWPNRILGCTRVTSFVTSGNRSSSIEFNALQKASTAAFGPFEKGLSVGADSVLHAQAKLPANVVAEIDVKDRDGYTKDFLPKAQADIKESGSKYLAGGANKAISLDGSPPPNRVVLLQFPDMDTLKAFNVKQRQLEADVGNKYASFRTVGIEGVGGAEFPSGPFQTCRRHPRMSVDRG